MKEENSTMGIKSLLSVTKTVSAALAVVLFTLAPASCSINLYRDSGRRIAYERIAGGTTRIYVIRMGNSTEIPLTGDGEYSGRPAWSPDGSRIAFQSLIFPDTSTLEVYVMNGDGSGRVNISRRDGLADGSPSWSPDGSKIAWLAGRSDATTTLMIADSDGSNPENLTPALNVNNQALPGWSPDSGKITVAADEGGGIYQIHVVNVGTKTVSPPLTSGSGNKLYPVWSPDGKKIAYQSRETGTLHICVINPDGSGKTDLTPGAASNIIPAWSPDSGKIAFLSDAGNPPNVYFLRVMNRDGSNSRTLNSAQMDNNQQLNWAPDGKTILGVSGYVAPPYTLFVASLEGIVTPLMGPSTNEMYYPSWTPR